MPAHVNRKEHLLNTGVPPAQTVCYTVGQLFREMQNTDNKPSISDGLRVDICAIRQQLQSSDALHMTLLGVTGKFGIRMPDFLRLTGHGASGFLGYLSPNGVQSRKSVTVSQHAACVTFFLRGID